MEFQPADMTIENSPVTLDLSLKSYGYHERLPKGNLFGHRIGTDYVMQYCTRGKGTFLVGDLVFPIKKGECMVTFPGSTRVEQADDIDPWGLMWIGFNGKSADAFIARLGVTPENPVLRKLEHSDIPLLLKKIIDVADTVGFQRDFLLAERLFAFFDKCIEFCSHAQSHSPCMADSYVAQATYFLEAHFSDQSISVQSLADSIGINRSYLYEIFKEKTGLSPQEYLTHLRISKALEFMLLPQATVTSVANSVGYEPSVFSKAFKKAMGVTPKTYMEENR